MSDPVTAVCIVDRKNSCPPGYVLVDRTAEGEDADLWKDSFFSSKVKRYICYTKSITASYWNHIVTNIILIGIKDTVPQGYTALRETIDTKESALKKHILCIKLLPKTATDTGITDFQLMRTEKYKVEQFTNVGEVNGINIVYKLSRLQKTISSRPAPLPPVVAMEHAVTLGSSPPPIPRRPNVALMSPPFAKHEPLAAISGISFKLHDRLTKGKSNSLVQDNMNITVKSRSELDAMFDYDFSRERGLMSR